MSVIYRPHRGGLSDSMAEAKEFETLGEMFKYICDDTNEWYKKLGHCSKPLKVGDIVLMDMGNDDRIGWRDYMYVCVKRTPCEEYDYPQCIGMCATDYNSEWTCQFNMRL